MVIKEGKPYLYKCGGVELAKVLKYYGYIPEIYSSEYKIVCPFHNDLNPSMAVNFDKGTFFCYGCGCTGDAFRFVELLNKKNNDLQNIILFQKILKSKQVCSLDFSKRVKQKKPNKELYDIACDYYYGLSTVDWIKDKSKDVVEASDYMLKRGFTKKTLSKCGAKITYNKSYMIIFPMYDNEVFKGWVCRTTLKDVEKKRKYLYNEGFMRRTTLVGNYKNYPYVIVVEGYMDRLKFVQYGVENVVAILGWKMSKEQEKKLKDSKINHVISALDNDGCGRKGTEYLRTIFNKVTRFCYLKGVKDPGEMSKELFDKMYQKTLKKLAQDRRKR